MSKVPHGAYPDFHKGMIAMRSWLLGKGYALPLCAMDLASKVHTGVRKDGTTPEFQHQMAVAYYLRTIDRALQYPQVSLAAAFLHDSVEDGKVRQDDIAALGNQMLEAVVLRLNKRGKSTSEYYRDVSNCPAASIVKASDRIHNHQSMVGVFTEEKQRAYVKETTEYVLPMVKKAQRQFSQQFDAYENAKHILKCQVDLVVRINGW